MAGRSDVRALTVSDENAASTTRIAAAARPATAFTLANTDHAGGAGRNVTVTTTGTGDNAKTVTIVGTDVFGNALTELVQHNMQQTFLLVLDHCVDKLFLVVEQD